MNEGVSVIIPVYNTGCYIDKCIRSVLQQRDVNVEIIVVDDGSIDNSLEVLKLLGKQYANIVVIENKHAGASTARNTGIKYATKEYISFLDSDDWLDADTYTTAINNMKENNLDVFFFDWMEEYYDGTSANKGREGKCFYLWQDDEILKTFFLNHTNLRVSSSLIRRELLDNVRFDENRIMGEDMLFIFQTLCNAKRIAYVDLPLYHRYHRVGSITNVIGFNKNKFEQAEATDIMIEYVKNNCETLISYAYVYSFNFYMQILNLLIYYRTEKKNQDIYEKVMSKLDCLYKKMDKKAKGMARKFCYPYRFFLLSKTLYFGFVQIYYRIIKRELGTKRQRER